MGQRPWMKLWVADYLGDTQHLTTLEHGAYLLLIMAYWQRGSLPADEDDLARIARLSPYLWKKHRETLAGLFGPGWRHKKIDEQIENFLRRPPAQVIGNERMQRGNRRPFSKRN